MSGHQIISCERARELLAAGQVTVLDMRDYRSYRAKRIEGALLLHDGLQQAIVNENDVDKPILIYCYRGITSKEKAEYFLELGFKHAYSLEGGFTEWSKAAPGAQAAGSQ
ncbi:MAG TPA: rhodanese-like domain-containing protein [Polyangiales bacterium]|nr:rhodanese-like domain-containing protein [Polyangiales bacterium]